MIIHKILALLSVATLAEGQLTLAPDRRQLSIVVKGDDGSVVGDARVLLRSTTPPGARQRLLKQESWRATTSAEGAATFNFLPPGPLTVCVSGRSPWLNPCDWGSERPSVSVSGAAKEVTANIILKRGAPIIIEVEDSGGLISQYQGKTPGAHLLLGVRNDAGMFTTASLVSDSSRIHLYSIVIPFDTRVNLVVASPFFRLTDSSGAEFAATGATSVPLFVQSGRAPAAIRIGISGRKS